MFVPTMQAEVSDSLFAWGFHRATWLRDRLQGVAVRKAQARAYKRFARRHPRWAASLFDEHFLTRHAAGLLLRASQPYNRPAPIELASAWLSQCKAPGAVARASELSEVIPVAADFLRYFEDELARYQGRTRAG